MAGVQIGRSARLQTGVAGGTIGTLAGYDKANGQTGMIAPSCQGWFPTATALTASRANIAKFVPSRDMTINSIAFAVTTLGADVACDVGIYDAALARVAVSTAAAGRLNTTGVKNIALTAPFTVRAGVKYYAGFSSDAASTATLLHASFTNAFGANMFGTTAGIVEADWQAAGHPLPATFTLTGLISAVVMLALREA